MNNEDLISTLAKKIGFDLIGFSKVEILSVESERLQAWLENGYHAEMTYLEKNLEKRKDVRQIMSNAKSVISLGLNYYNDSEFTNKKNYGKISRYSWGKDYHFVMWDMIDELMEQIKKNIEGFEGKAFVDTGPVMDKVWAVKSGLGWMGKNSNVINKKMGSYFFIGNIFTNLSLRSSEMIADFCGNCNACINACPTQAIVENKVIDSNRCISFLTIENKNEIPERFVAKFDGWLFGCDICQEVCPWNIKFALNTKISEFYNNQIRELDLDEVSELNNEVFLMRFGKSPIKRAKLDGLKRNAQHLKKSL